MLTPGCAQVLNLQPRHPCGRLAQLFVQQAPRIVSKQNQARQILRQSFRRVAARSPIASLSSTQGRRREANVEFVTSMFLFQWTQKEHVKTQFQRRLTCGKAKGHQTSSCADVQSCQGMPTVGQYRQYRIKNSQHAWGLKLSFGRSDRRDASITSGNATYRRLSMSQACGSSNSICLVCSPGYA